MIDVRVKVIRQTANENSESRTVMASETDEG